MRRTAFFTCLLIGSAAFAADNAAYLPADTDVVLTMQARNVAESELGKKIGGDLLQQVLRASKPAAALVEASGLDPLKDFDRITAGLDLKKNPARVCLPDSHTPMSSALEEIYYPTEATIVNQVLAQFE